MQNGISSLILDKKNSCHSQKTQFLDQMLLLVVTYVGTRV